MKIRDTARRLAANSAGAAVIEFALLGPIMIAMILGILWVGVQMQAYNGLRSAASDAGRYAVVEYQKSNKLTPTQLSEVVATMASRAPYNLASDRLDVAVTQQASPVANVKKFDITISYTAPSFLDFIGVGSPLQSFTQTVFVPV